jgi:hypothetical protein
VQGDVTWRVKSPSWYDQGSWSGLMNHLESILYWSTLSFEIVLVGFVFARKVQRILPLFAAYACVLLTCEIGLWLTYKYFGFTSSISPSAYWGSIVLTAAARSLAIAELCRYGLRAYLGIWAFIWRVLTALSILLLVHVARDAWGQPNGVAIYGATLDRDLALASIFILAVLLLIRNYYGLVLEPLQRAIAVGICFICAIDVIGNTILRNLYTGYLFSWFSTSQKDLWPALKPQIDRVNDLWSTVHLVCFMCSMGIWCYALRKPVPAPLETPVLLPAEVYRELSPAINLRLTTFNDRMVELLKP